MTLDTNTREQSYRIVIHVLLHLLYILLSYSYVLSVFGMNCMETPADH